MQHARKSDQTADAFSLPTELLQKVRDRAAELGMTKSGFYRYCLAKELGHDEETARAYSLHRAVLNTLESNSSKASPVSMAARKIRKRNKPAAE